MNFKHINFLCGLPRSGSTLLATLLNQHPKIHASPHSALLNALSNLPESFTNSETVKYGLQISACQKTLWTMPQHFYQYVEKDIIVDKQFTWSTKENYELATKISSYPRFIVTYRPILEVLASFVAKSIDNPDFYLNKDLETYNFYPKNYLSKNDALAEYLMIGHDLLPRSISGLAYAKQNEKQGNFKFVAYDDLVNNTEQVMNDIFNFMDVEPMELETERVENIFYYNDQLVLGTKDFHFIRPEIKKESPKPEDLFSDYILDKYKNALSPIGL